MKPSLTQENRKKLWDLAEENGWKPAAIAEAIGVRLDSLVKAIAKQYENSSFWRDLDPWLVQFAHLRPEEIVKSAAVQESPALYANRGALWHAGQKLIDLGREMQDAGNSVDWRLFQYEDWVNRAYAQLKRFRSECESTRE